MRLFTQKFAIYAFWHDLRRKLTRAPCTTIMTGIFIRWLVICGAWTVPTRRSKVERPWTLWRQTRFRNFALLAARPRYQWIHGSTLLSFGLFFCCKLLRVCDHSMESCSIPEKRCLLSVHNDMWTFCKWVIIRVKSCVLMCTQFVLCTLISFRKVTIFVMNPPKLYCILKLKYFQIHLKL